MLKLEQMKKMNGVLMTNKKALVAARRIRFVRDATA